MVIRNVTHATVANNRFVKRCWTTFTIQNGTGQVFTWGGSLNAEEPPEDQNPLNPVCISLRKFFAERDCAILVKGQSTLLAWNVLFGKLSYVIWCSWSSRYIFLSNFFVTNLLFNLGNSAYDTFTQYSWSSLLFLCNVLIWSAHGTKELFNIFFFVQHY